MTNFSKKVSTLDKRGPSFLVPFSPNYDELLQFNKHFSNAYSVKLGQFIKADFRCKPDKSVCFYLSTPYILCLYNISHISFSSFSQQILTENHMSGTGDTAENKKHGPRPCRITAQLKETGNKQANKQVITNHHNHCKERQACYCDKNKINRVEKSKLNQVTEKLSEKMTFKLNSESFSEDEELCINTTKRRAFQTEENQELRP